MVNSNQENINVMVFENPEFGRVRTIVDKNGEPLFCGKDVCEALGYKKPRDAVYQHVNPHDAVKRGIRVACGKKADGSPAMKSIQMLFVNESGVYSLVFGSKLESAQRFKHWVTSVVLPAIRKNGGYFHINPDETAEQIKARFEKVLAEALAERDATIRQKDTLIQHCNSVIAQSKDLIAEQTTRIRQLDKIVDEQVVKIQKSAEEIVNLEGDIDRLMPKAFYADNVLDSISCYTTTQIAKELGCTAQELNRSLCACHIQYYQSGQYLLYADYAHMGLAKSRTRYKAVVDDEGSANGEYANNGEKTGRIYTHTYLVWTERGRKFIHNLAKRLLDGARLYQEMEKATSIR